MSKSNFKTSFGAAVKSRRNDLGISQEKLAERASLHRTYVSDVERGSRNISLENIERLARALDISVSALFPAATSATVQTSPSGGGHLVEILLVEDNPDDEEMTLRAFKKARFANRVQVVRDGAEALDYLFRSGQYADRTNIERPQVILLDLNLPKVNGLKVLSQLKADQRTAIIPVVILTVSDDNYDVAECRRLGAENYIVKPVDFRQFSRITPGLNLDWALVKASEPKSDGVKK